MVGARAVGPRARQQVLLYQSTVYGKTGTPDQRSPSLALGPRKHRLESRSDTSWCFAPKAAYGARYGLEA